MWSRLALLLLLLLLVWCLPAAATELSGQVQRVYDGDTLLVEGVGKVRLLGIDSPEMLDSPRDRYYSEKLQIPPQLLRRVARQAREFCRERAQGRIVRLETDREERDQYQRLLAYVYLPDGGMLNRQLLEAGLAAVFRKYTFRLKEDFFAAEALARSTRRGLWRLP